MGHSWEVTCVDTEGDAESCNDITTIGYLVGNSLKTIGANSAAMRINQENKLFHVEIDGDRYELEGAGSGVDAYPRTADSDTSTDPLLTLPSIDEFSTRLKNDNRFEK